MKSLELDVMSILCCYLIPVMTSPSLPVSQSEHYTTPTTSSQHWHGPTFTCTVCSLSPSCSLLGILLTDGRLPPNLSLICCRDRVILGECMVVCILTAQSLAPPRSSHSILRSLFLHHSRAVQSKEKYCCSKARSHLYLKIMKDHYTLIISLCKYICYWSLDCLK